MYSQVTRDLEKVKLFNVENNSLQKRDIIDFVF